MTLIIAASVYLLIFQNSLFMANFNSQSPSNQPQLKVVAALPENPSPPWVMDGFAYACGGKGPGVLLVTNNEQATRTIIALSLAYGGMTYAISGPKCSIAAGTTAISIVALGAPAGSHFSPYGGYIVTSDGDQISFSGIWS